jgi:hypothetical protein
MRLFGVLTGVTKEESMITKRERGRVYFGWWRRLPGVVRMGLVVLLVGAVAAGVPQLLRTGAEARQQDAQLSLEPTYLLAGFQPDDTETASSTTRAWVRNARPGEPLQTRVESFEEDGSMHSDFPAIEASGTEQVRLEVSRVEASTVPHTDRFGVVDQPEVRGVTGIAFRENTAFDPSVDLAFGEQAVCIAWVENDSAYRICASGTPSMLPPIDELVRIADGLH